MGSLHACFSYQGVMQVSAVRIEKKKKKKTPKYARGHFQQDTWSNYAKATLPFDKDLK